MTGLGTLADFLESLFQEGLPVSLLKICVLIAVAYLLSRGPLFRRLLLYRTSTGDKIKVFFFFAALSLLEWWLNPTRFRNPTGEFFASQDTSVNSGLVAAVTAGLLIGPGMGFAVGILTYAATLAAMFITMTKSTPAFTLLINPGIAAAIGGLLGGWVMQFRPTTKQQQAAGFLVGSLSQAVWISIGLVRETTLMPESALASLGVLIAPWIAAILSGGLGVLFFLWIIGDLKAQQERIGSVQIQRALGIANQTLPFLRQGLNSQSARPIAEIVYSVAEVGGVAVTDGRRILSHVGAGSDHHHAGDALPLFLPDESFEEGIPKEFVLDQKKIGCHVPGCPLTSGVLSTLVHEGEVIGGVLIYGVELRPTNPEMVRLGVGLAQFFSNYQIELAELERQTQAASQAELKALQSQIHPHFLFNVLNTLAALCEIDPKEAGKLTVRLGAFLRRSLRESPAPLIPLREEMENVRSYLEIEQARFGDKMTVVQEIEEEAMDALVPSFGLQILVENAILHGISKKIGPGKVLIRAKVRNNRLWCCVRDEGPGFTPERQEQVFSGNGRASGMVVLRERGRRLLGRQFLLRILGRKNSGTAVIMALPLPRFREEGEMLPLETTTDPLQFALPDLNEGEKKRREAVLTPPR